MGTNLQTEGWDSLCKGKSEDHGSSSNLTEGGKEELEKDPHFLPEPVQRRNITTFAHKNWLSIQVGESQGRSWKRSDL